MAQGEYPTPADVHAFVESVPAAKEGDWGSFRHMEHQLQYGPTGKYKPNQAANGLENQQQLDPGFPPMGPQPDITGEPTGQ